MLILFFVLMRPQLEAFGADVYQFYVNGAPVGSFDSNADLSKY